MNAEEIYDAAEMQNNKGFSDEGHRAGLAAVVAAAKAEALEGAASLVVQYGAETGKLRDLKFDLRARAAAIREGQK